MQSSMLYAIHCMAGILAAADHRSIVKGYTRIV